MPHTRDISSAVGTTRNKIDCRMNVTPLQHVQRSELRHKESWRVTNVLSSAVYCTRESASLSRKMEFEVEVEQMPKRLARDGADCALTDVREYCVQQFAEKCRTYARRAVYRS